MRVDVSTIIQLLQGKTLADADQTLDTARRIIWTVQFIGGTWEQAAHEHRAEDSTALAIARHFEGAPLTTANSVLEEVRFACWMEQCQTIEGSRFVQQIVDLHVTACAASPDIVN